MTRASAPSEAASSFDESGCVQAVAVRQKKRQFVSRSGPMSARALLRHMLGRKLSPSAVLGGLAGL